MLIWLAKEEHNVGYSFASAFWLAVLAYCNDIALLGWSFEDISDGVDEGVVGPVLMKNFYQCFLWDAVICLFHIHINYMELHLPVHCIFCGVYQCSDALLCGVPSVETAL